MEVITAMQEIKQLHEIAIKAKGAQELRIDNSKPFEAINKMKQFKITASFCLTVL